jgi:hypothetical protein
VSFLRNASSMSSASVAWRVFLAGKPRTAQSSIWPMELRVSISKSNSLRLLADASIAKTGFAEAKRLFRFRSSLTAGRDSPWLRIRWVDQGHQCLHRQCPPG